MAANAQAMPAQNAQPLSFTGLAIRPAISPAIVGSLNEYSVRRLNRFNVHAMQFAYIFVTYNFCTTVFTVHFPHS